MTIDQFLEIANKSWPVATLIVMALLIWWGIRWLKTKVIEPILPKIVEAIQTWIANTDANTKTLESQTTALETIQKRDDDNGHALAAIASDTRAIADIKATQDRFRVVAIHACEAFKSHATSAEAKGAAERCLRILETMGNNK